MVYKTNSNPTLISEDSIIIDIYSSMHLRCFGAVEFYKDANCIQPSIPISGTLEFSIKSETLSTQFQNLDDGDVVIQDTGNTQISWFGNTLQLKVTGLSSVQGDSVAYAKLICTSNP